MRLAVVLFNLGGPDSLEAVEPFLRNLFNDPAILSVPGFMRRALAHVIARRRARFARDIYAQIGGRSPILEQTRKQADALDKVLANRGIEAKCFVAMRCWHPFSGETAAEVQKWGAERLVLLPLYPQFSTTTTASSLLDWKQAAGHCGLTAPAVPLCCYPDDAGFIEAMAELTHRSFTGRKQTVDYRLLLSAHGLPRRIITRGDPYQWQIERTATALVEKLGIKDLDWTICYQSRVGPLAWIGPSTDDEIRRAGNEGKGIILVPLSFVSEHSETLVELDIEYAKLAAESGVPDYRRVPTVGTHPAFIGALANLVMRASADGTTTNGGTSVCPATFGQCGCREIGRVRTSD